MNPQTRSAYQSFPRGTAQGATLAAWNANLCPNLLVRIVPFWQSTLDVVIIVNGCDPLHVRRWALLGSGHLSRFWNSRHSSLLLSCRPLYWFFNEARGPGSARHWCKHFGVHAEEGTTMFCSRLAGWLSVWISQQSSSGCEKRWTRL